MPAPLSLPDLAVGAHVEETLLVWDVEQRTQSDGSPFVILTLANSTGRLKTAPFWSSDLHLVSGVEKGAVVSVVGELGTYRADRQLKVASLRPVPREMADWTRLLPSVGDVAPWWK